MYVLYVCMYVLYVYSIVSLYLYIYDHQVPQDMRAQELVRCVLEKRKELEVGLCWSLFEVICNGELG